MLDKLPFQSNLCLDTPDFAEAEAFINSRVDQRELSVLSVRHHSRNLLTTQTLRRTQLFGVHWGGKVHIRSGQLSASHIVFLVAGSIRVNSLDTQLRAGEMLLLTPETCADLVWEAGSIAMVLTVDPWSVGDRLALRKDELVKNTARVFGSEAQVTRAMLALFRGIDSHSGIFNGNLSPSLQEQWESMLIETSTDLLVNCSNTEPDILPAHIRRTIDWIMSNLDQTMSVTEIASVACCSRRSLEHGFKTFIGKSPARFVLEKKMEVARDKLLRAQGNVSEVAYMCGFNHLSYFTSIYKELYGEAPSQTLKRRSLVTKKEWTHLRGRG